MNTHRRSLNLLASLAIATTTLLASNSALASKNWNDWYPLDRGQNAGQRAINSWGAPSFPGQSTCKYSSTPSGLPGSYGGESVQYFLNWWDLSPTLDDYAEIMSIRGAGDTLLDLWAMGTSANWKVFYDPTSMTHVAIEDMCTTGAIATMSNRAAAGPKEPLIWRLPDGPNSAIYQSNLVCAAVFGDANHPYDYNVVTHAAWEWVEVKTVAANSSEVHATNYYYTSDQSRCLPGYGSKNKTRSMALQGTYNGITVEGCVWAVEDYGMKKVPSSRLSGGLFDISITNKWNHREAEDSSVLFSIEDSFC